MASEFHDAKTKRCPSCGYAAERKPLFTSFYYQCMYIYCADYRNEIKPSKGEYDLATDSYKPTAGGIVPPGKGVYTLPPGFTVNRAALNLGGGPKATHTYNVTRGQVEIQFQKAGDTISVNGGTAWTVPTDGYYQINERGIIRL